MLRIDVNKINGVMQTSIALTSNTVKIEELAYALHFLRPGLYASLLLKELHGRLPKKDFGDLVEEIHMIEEISDSVKDQIEFEQAKHPIIGKVEIEHHD